jgi:hypothetical protein
VYEFILEKNIGVYFSSTYEKMASYFESELYYFRYADKILRKGLKLISETIATLTDELS